MILSDRDIIDRIENGSLVIEPYDESNVEPASVDVRLGTSFKRPVMRPRSVIDTRGDGGQAYEEFEADEITLDPGACIVATTKEHIEIPRDLCANADGRSSLGRLFVSVHHTAGFCDPGYKGEVTLEITNANRTAVRLHADDRICQLVFKELSSPALRPYGHEGSQYQNQSGATESGMNFE